MFLSLESGEPLRAGRSRLQKRRLKKLRSDLRQRALNQVSMFGRSAFRGEVSLEASIFTSGDFTSTPRILKAYLDLLKGIAYKDDRSVAHLVVDRWDLKEDRSTRPLTRGASGESVKVHLSIRPLRIYKEQFQRANLAADDDDESPWRGRHRMIEPDDSELRAGDIERLFPDASTERQNELRIFFEQEVARRRTELLTSLPFGPHDLPDGDVSMWMVEGLHPAVMMLPLPHRRPRKLGWKAELRAALARHRDSWSVFSKQLNSSLALDIAVPRQASFVDLDNLAAELLLAIEEVLFARPELVITTYRIYWVLDSVSALCVRLMNPMVIRDLDQAITATHERLR